MTATVALKTKHPSLRVLAIGFVYCWFVCFDYVVCVGQVVELSKESETRCLDILRAGMASDHFWPSIHAAEGLTLAGRGDEVRKHLAPKLAMEEDDQKRCGLARELVRAGDLTRVAVMLDILASEDPYGHVHAAESLFKVAEIGDGRGPRAAFAKSEDGPLKLMAAAALGRAGNPAAMRYLRKSVADTNPDTSRIAAWILGRIGDDSDIPRLREHMPSQDDPLVRCYFEHSLASLGDRDGLEALIRNLASDDPSIQTYAATFAGDANAVSAADQLQDLLKHENLDVRVRAAQSLLVLSKPKPPSIEADYSNLVYPATAEHPRYTEGSIVRLVDGSLLYAVTQFVGGGSDFSNARIVARRSSDQGRTWAPPQVLQESTGKMNVMSVTLRRLAEPRQQTIAMFYLRKNAFDDLRVYVRFSQDEAETFGKPIRVTNQPGYHVMNNDRVTQLATGRLLAPVASTPDVKKVNHFVSRCWLSDDGGTTWRQGVGAVDQPRRGAMEPEVVELKDGRVMMIVRTQLGYIARSISDDGGDTWSDAIPLSDLRAPEAPATIRRIPSTGDLLLIWNNTYTSGAGHGGRRTPLTAAISSDDGATWHHIRDLETRRDRTYSYPSLIFANGRAVMSYWESRDDKLSSRFRAVPISWLYAD